MPEGALPSVFVLFSVLISMVIQLGLANKPAEYARPLTFRAKQEKVASSPASSGETEGDKLTEDAGSNNKS